MVKFRDGQYDGARRSATFWWHKGLEFFRFLPPGIFAVDAGRNSGVLMNASARVIDFDRSIPAADVRRELAAARSRTGGEGASELEELSASFSPAMAELQNQ